MVTLKKVIIWGTGNRMRVNRYLFSGMEVLYYCNNEINKEPYYIDGIKVINPSQINDKIKEHPGLKIIIASVRELDIYEQCVHMGISKYVELFFIERNTHYSYGNHLTYYAGMYDDYYDTVHGSYKKEFLPCKVIKMGSEKILDIGNVNEKHVFAIKALEQDTNIEVYTKEAVYNKTLDADHFEYFKKDNDGTLKIKPDKNIVMSKVWNINNNKKGKLVLHIVCDSLAQNALQDRQKEVMPDTYKYFENGISFANCYCCTDWTLPGVATIETGEYPVSHQLLHPKECGCITGKTLFEKFHEKGWFTACIGGNWRADPGYGYLKGIDRMVYVYGEHKGGIMEVLHDFIEMVRVFRNKDLFITLNLYDLHHYMKDVPDIGEQIGISLENHFYTEVYEGKSVHAYYNINEYGQYIEKLKKTDYYLNILYSFLDKEYGDSCNVIFTADHGVVAPIELDKLHKQNCIDQRLAERMTKVPVYMKGYGINKENLLEVVDNTAVHKVISLLVTQDSINNEMVHNTCKQDFAYNESIYPGQTYIAEVIDGKYHFYFETDDLVSEKCVIPSGSFKAKLFETESGYEIEEEEIKRAYISVVQQHIGKQLDAQDIKTSTCRKCRKQNKNKCTIPSYIEKGIL